MGKEILWVSLYVPYDGVGHAGGKIENFYLKKLKKVFFSNIFLISFYSKKEELLIDLDNYGIDANLICTNKWYKPFIDAESTLNPYNRYACSLQSFYEYHLKKAMRAYRKKHGNPALVLLQWTQIVLLSDYVKQIFNNVPVIAIEEDVQFLSYKRYWVNTTNIFEKWIWKTRYEKLKKVEIEKLHISNKICLNNYKDRELLEQNGIEPDKMFTWVPWFEHYNNLKINPQNKNILFYGAMNRPENYLSALWFIDNVFNKIKRKGYRFIIAGSNPDKSILKYRSDVITVTGFVKEISKYFEQSLCLVAPLVLGAGIKIKVLEAMSAGLPVLTNQIGIEGIPAQNGIHYYYCERPQEYIDTIERLNNNSHLHKLIGKNAKQFIEENYDLEQSFLQFYNVVLELMDS